MQVQVRQALGIESARLLLIIRLSAVQCSSARSLGIRLIAIHGSVQHPEY